MLYCRQYTGSHSDYMNGILRDERVTSFECREGIKFKRVGSDRVQPGGRRFSEQSSGPSDLDFKQKLEAPNYSTI